MKAFLPIYLIRVNLHNREEKVKSFFENNEIAILVNQTYEIEYWNFVFNGNFDNPKPKPVQFIQRWHKLLEQLVKSDVLVIAKYLGNSNVSKIGILRKDSEFEERVGGLKILKLSDVTEIENIKHPILNSIIPHQVTISPVKQREALIHYLYNNKEYEKPVFCLKNISPNLIELICLEWLRSDAISKRYQKFKIRFQYLKIGGNYADVDIFAETFEGKKIACQVTNTDATVLLKNKARKLLDFESDFKILFCNDNSIQTNKEIEIILINDVWKDLSASENYKEFLEFLINN